MQFVNLRNSFIRLLVRLICIAGGMLLTFLAPAQTPVVGKVLYEKLAKTQQEYQEAMATGDSLEVAEVCYLLGKRYNALGDYVNAQAWYIRSLRIREPLGPSENIGKTYLRMAENQIRQKQYNQAKRLVSQATANFRHIHSQHGMMGATIVMAGVHELGWRMNRDKPGSAPFSSLDSSLYYFKQAEQLAISLKKPFDIANVYACMGNALMQKDGNLALPYLKKAYAINRQERSPYGIINSSQGLANCYLALGQPLIAKKWLDEAKFICDTARHGDYWQNDQLEESYTRVYERMGNWKQAFLHQRKYYSFQVDALTADREGAIARAGMLYESEKKEAKLKAQQNELELRQQNLNTQKRLSLMTTVLFVLAGLACLVFYWLFRKYRRISEHNAKLVKEQNHRVKNNLQSITNLLGLQFNRLTDPAARKAVEESLLRVEAMALVHRRLYDGDRLIEVDLMQFIPELVNGVLRSYSFGHIQPIYSLSPIWLNADVAINVGLLLNELATNSCKYALPLHSNPVLTVGCQEENGRILFWYEDNGPGFTPSTKGNSFGMKLIDMITQKLKGKGHFSAENGCRFTLSFDAKAMEFVH
ncbi:histidine kinase dimerization/phosphoacceptor domain -containing protein [Spirosoma endbachense]|uniref:histidine kinase n=1 Tax=Spirosoma endbachense TaxID=2666025 RepID=A0A6P1VVQ6_9BACT|nr:histidine kinase dimerization/phosphoacceptor domain -containing protein [Spirosoma endbachense]QHV95749.1 hypothetical protein GJR95_12335 [Spirosoma endbachense]